MINLAVNHGCCARRVPGMINRSEAVVSQPAHRPPTAPGPTKMRALLEPRAAEKITPSPVRACP